MRVLVVDQDSTLLTAITRTLGEYFNIDAVTNKADCLDLVRLNDFDVIVAGERLEDGSGLELLGQLARSRPDMLRIFAAERERLKLLKGRLGPFGLFRTLAYPIQPRQLLAALSAAAGTEEDLEDTSEVEADEVETPPAAEPEAAQTVARRQALAPAGSWAVAGSSVSTPSASRASQASAVSAPSPSRAPQSSAAPASLRSPLNSAAPASTSARTAALGLRVGSPASAPAPSVAKAPALQAASPRQTSSSRASTRPRAAMTPGQPRQAPRQPTSEALAAAAKLDIVTRPKGFPPPSETTPGRSAFLVGAGVILVIGGLALSFKIFNTKDAPVTVTTNASATRSPRFPPEVVKLVADTEVAFQQDNFKTARTDVAALQQIAPDHPRLPFFESLLKRLAANNREVAEKTAASRPFLRRTSVSGGSDSTATSGASGSYGSPGASGPSGSLASAVARRQPDADRDAPSTSEAIATPTSSTTSSTFAGRTLDDSSPGAPATQPEATPAQATPASFPRRPGSATQPTDIQEPRLVQHVAAEYPKDAEKKGIEGSVDVSFTVTSQGKVTDVLVVDAVPSEIFNRAAVAAVRRWKYEPKTMNGIPVESHQQLRLQFKLDPHGH